MAEGTQLAASGAWMAAGLLAGTLRTSTTQSGKLLRGFGRYWECKRRLTQLRRFRVLAFDYFENVQLAGWASGGAPPRMNDVAQKARHEMNGIMEDVLLSFNVLRVQHVLAYQPVRPGEYAQPVDVIANVFALYQFQISSQVVF